MAGPFQNTSTWQAYGFKHTGKRYYKTAVARNFLQTVKRNFEMVLKLSVSQEKNI